MGWNDRVGGQSPGGLEMTRQRVRTLGHFFFNGCWGRCAMFCRELY